MSDALVITTNTTGDLLTIAVCGELDILTEAALLEAFAARVTAHNKSDVVLDVSDVSFIDSSGLRALLLCGRSAKERSTTLKLRCGEGQVAKLLRISGVESAFDYA